MTATSYLHVFTPEDVVDHTSFARYCQQRLGTPMPRGSHIAAARRAINRFFEENPRANWRTLCRVADWCRAKRRRPATLMGVVASFRWAWSDGAVPECEPREIVDDDLEAAINTALESETDEVWRRMLIGAYGLTNRREVLNAWRTSHQRVS